MLAGTLLFVLGFTAVFVSLGALFGGLGAWLIEHTVAIQRVLGVITILMGLAFMGLLPGSTREWRIHRAPTMGLIGAPMLGILFGLGWTPCIGPTLAAVQSLALTQASALRGAILTTAYCLGLGIPFILVGLGLRRVAGGVGWVKRHYPVGHGDRRWPARGPRCAAAHRALERLVDRHAHVGLRLSGVGLTWPTSSARSRRSMRPRRG